MTNSVDPDQTNPTHSEEVRSGYAQFADAIKMETLVCKISGLSTYTVRGTEFYNWPFLDSHIITEI